MNRLPAHSIVASRLTPENVAITKGGFVTVSCCLPTAEASIYQQAYVLAQKQVAARKRLELAANKPYQWN